MAIIHSFLNSILLIRFLKPFFFIFLVLLFFCYFYFFVNLFTFFFAFILKFFFLGFFFIFNILNFFLFLNVYDFLFLALDWLDASYLNVFFFSIVKLFLVFVFDLCSFCKLVLFTSLDPRNFVGIFFSIAQFLNELMYEAIFQFIEQTEDHIMVSEFNWMPRYIFGDMVERSFRFNKIFNLFKFSDLFYEKTFVYKRVGILHSRFWIFRHFNFVKKTDFRFRQETGVFVEPDRWLLDFRDLKLSDYLDPWHFFSNQAIFRDSREIFLTPTYRKRGDFISVQLLHNYYSVMETNHINPAERTYADCYVTSVFFYEILFVFLTASYLLATMDLHLGLKIFDIDAEDLEAIDKGDVNLNIHPYIEYWDINDSVESKFFSMYPMDFYEYTRDDDLSWDFLLAQPKSLQIHDPSDLEEFETYKELNSLFDEFRTFSFLYPLYRLALKLSSYKMVDFFLFTDSGQCFRIIFFCLLYLPIGFIIVLFKLVLKFYDWFANFHLFSVI